MTPRFQISTLTHDEQTPPTMGDRTWDVAVLSADIPLDDRSKAATAFATGHAKRSFTLKFSVDTNLIRVDGSEAAPGRLRAQLTGAKSLLVEATSLSYPELLYVLTAATREKVKVVSLLYVEPREYRRPIEERLCDHRNFDLSANRRFRSIPMFMTNLSEIPKGQAVFFLGYEGARLSQALQQAEVLQSWMKHAVFGVPAFESAWEIDAIANNIDHLTVKDAIKYVAASSAAAAYRLLSEMRANEKEGHPILVAPLGTKPHAIGAALFLIEHNGLDQAVLLYDHPERTSQRTLYVRRWHVYDVIDSLAAP